MASTLDEFFSSTREEPAVEESVGVETEWLPMGEAHFPSGRIWIGDVSVLGSEEDGLVVELEPGDYQVELKGIEYGWDKRISAMRVFSSEGEEGDADLGEAWSDVATVAVCDTAWFDRASRDLADTDLMDVIGDNVAGFIDLFEDDSANVAFTSSGFGDGAFPVCELVRGGRRVGFVVQFIECGESYPFPTQDPPGAEE